MSLAEMKLELIRVINRMSPEQIEQLFRQVSRQEAARPSAPRLRFGALKGMLLYMSPDFDAPLEDFKEYM